MKEIFTNWDWPSFIIGPVVGGVGIYVLLVLIKNTISAWLVTRENFLSVVLALVIGTGVLSIGLYFISGPEKAPKWTLPTFIVCFAILIVFVISVLKNRNNAH